MISTWWVDAVLVFFLIFLVIGIYKLSIREFTLLKGDNLEIDELSILETKGSKLYPDKLIRRAGFLPVRMAPAYWLIKLSLAAIYPFLLLEVAQGEVTSWKLILSSATGFFCIDVFLYFRARRRKQQIANKVSYFVDLLVAFLKSGLSLSQAFERAANYGLPKNTPLAKEVALVASEMQVGLAWQTGFERLGKRTGAKALERLALLMRIGQSTGSPMISSLSNYADLLRETQSERVNEMLNRKSMEALIPTLLLSLPVFLVLVFFPTGVQIFEAFRLFSVAW